jgi:hypothetical protein
MVSLVVFFVISLILGLLYMSLMDFLRNELLQGFEDGFINVGKFSGFLLIFIAAFYSIFFSVVVSFLSLIGGSFYNLIASWSGGVVLEISLEESDKTRASGENTSTPHS